MHPPFFAAICILRNFEQNQNELGKKPTGSVTFSIDFPPTAIYFPRTRNNFQDKNHTSLILKTIFFSSFFRSSKKHGRLDARAPGIFVSPGQSRDLQLSSNTLYLLSPRLCFLIVLILLYNIILIHDLFVYRDDSLTS